MAILFVTIDNESTASVSVCGEDVSDDVHDGETRKV
jgi:hypothetical protein